MSAEYIHTGCSITAPNMLCKLVTFEMLVAPSWIICYHQIACPLGPLESWKGKDGWEHDTVTPMLKWFNSVLLLYIWNFFPPVFKFHRGIFLNSCILFLAFLSVFHFLPLFLSSFLCPFPLLFLFPFPLLFLVFLFYSSLFYIFGFTILLLFISRKF